MRILSAERFDREELLSAIKRTRLRGFNGARPYADADLQLVPAMDPAVLAPAQNYVLRPGVKKALELRDALLPHGIDIFTLDGGAYFRTLDAPDESIPIIPPIVEESLEPDGGTALIINDGIHRIFAARSLELPISVVVVTNVPPEYPYYAFALRGGWSKVVELDDLPDNYQKKEYRHPANYKALFRDFNAIFPGVQKQRKKSNPEHLNA